jgi:5'-nucleotidase
LPYVAGYVRQVRAEEAAVLLVDAGDVTEKGDLVASRTEGVMTYEAMRRIGYDGVAVGNHDFDEVPPERIQRFESALGQVSFA